MLPTSLKRILATSISVMCAVSFTACGTAGSSGSTKSSASDTSNVLRVGTDPTVGLPYSSKTADQQDFRGIDVDLLRAVGKKLGKKVTVTSISFDALIPAIQSGRVDATAASMFDTKKRQKVVDFIDYYRTASGMIIAANASFVPDSIDDLCGHKVGAMRGAAEEAAAEEQSKKCTDAGKKALEIKQLPSWKDVSLAVKSGQIEVGLGDPGVWEYMQGQQPDVFKSVGKVFSPAYIGIAVAKDSKLTPQIKNALQELIDDGTYSKILAKYNLGNSQGKISTVTVNNGM